MTFPLAAKRVAALDHVDRLPPELRQLVHEYGLPIVSCFVKHGVKKPSAIRDLIRECWGGARQAGQRNGARDVLDWLLSRSEALSYAGLVRVLADSNLAIVSTAPTKAMLEASMAAVKPSDGLMSKTEKHRRRLVAAIEAA